MIHGLQPLSIPGFGASRPLKDATGVQLQVAHFPSERGEKKIEAGLMFFDDIGAKGRPWRESKRWVSGFTSG